MKDKNIIKVMYYHSPCGEMILGSYDGKLCLCDWADGRRRDVANANAVNAISIIAPCHRVIGSDGSLTGYRGGLERKRFLLDLEKNY